MQLPFSLINNIACNLLSKKYPNFLLIQNDNLNQNKVLRCEELLKKLNLLVKEQKNYNKWTLN